MGRGTPTGRFGFQPPTVQTGKAYHIRPAWPNAGDTRHMDAFFLCAGVGSHIWRSPQLPHGLSGTHQSRDLHSTAGVMLGMQILQPRPSDMGVDLSGGQVTVAQQHLHHPQVGAVVEQVRGEGMTQGMGGQ